MTIAITGATGHLGRLVIQKLKAEGRAGDIVALARDTGKAASLGVAVRAFDYAKPDTLAAALAGIDTLLLISSNEVGQRAAQHRNVIEAARKAGVKRIVYTSILRAESSPIDLAEEHRSTEAAIRSSGIPFTLLRNGWYNENYAGAIAGALQTGAVFGSAGEGRISSAARADYADAAAAVLTGTGHEGKIYELAGDESFSLAELAAEISRRSGRSIPYKDIPQADYAKALAGLGIPEGFARSIASWDIDIAGGALFDEGRQLSKLIGHPTAPIADAVAAAAA